MTAEGAHSLPEIEPLELDAKYSVNGKALRRWMKERLILSQRPDGCFDALFRYDGSTCSNMGRALAFEYRVVIASRQERYELRDLQCAPAPGDDGYTFMCRYRVVGSALTRDIAEEKPLLGRPLNEVLHWDRELIGPGCYCEGESRDHKWGLVLETIHFALAQRVRLLADAPPMQPKNER
ncbi:MAG: hypothetical protein ABJE47_21600 [bacterium]